MCFRIKSRSTTSAGAPRRPRQRLLGCRFASASYTAATMTSSDSTASACLIQPSRRSFTSAAINPSPKLSCARRISIMPLAPCLPHSPFRAQQVMIELADRLDRLLQFLIVAEPAAHLRNPLAPHADLACVSSRIGHGQDEHLVPFTACAFGTILRVSDRALQQRAAQQVAADRQLAHQLLTGPQGLLTNHSQE